MQNRGPTSCFLLALIVVLTASCSANDDANPWSVDETSEGDSCSAGLQETTDEFVLQPNGTLLRVLPSFRERNVVYQATIEIDPDRQVVGESIIEVQNRICHSSADPMKMKLLADVRWVERHLESARTRDPVWIYRADLGITSEGAVFGLGCNRTFLNQNEIERAEVTVVLEPDVWHEATGRSPGNPTQSPHELASWYDQYRGGTVPRQIPTDSLYASNPVDYSSPLFLKLYWPRLFPMSESTNEALLHHSSFCRQTGLLNYPNAPELSFEAAYVGQPALSANLPRFAREYLVQQDSADQE